MRSGESAVSPETATLGDAGGSLRYDYMSMKREIIKRVKNKIVIEFPLKIRRFNPYSGKYGGEMPNIVGVIEDDDFGLAYVVDRSYKGKDDDYTRIIYHWFGDESSFKEFCKENGLPILYR